MILVIWAVVPSYNNKVDADAVMLENHL